MSATQLEQVGKQLHDMRQDLKALYGKKNAEGKWDWSPDDEAKFYEYTGKPADNGVPEVKGKLSILHDEFKKLERIVNAEVENDREIEYMNKASSGAPIRGGPRTERARRKSVGQLVVDSPQYKSLVAGQLGSHGLASITLDGRWTGDLDAKTALLAGDEFGESEFKAVMTEATGFVPYTPRIADIVPFALRRPMVQDLMPMRRIDSYAMQYMEQTSLSRTAAGVAEGGSKPQSTIAYTARTANVEVVACYLPVTEQQIADVPFIMGEINGSLGLDVALAEEDAILSGNGSSPQLQGFTTKTGINTQASGADPIETAVFKSFTQIRAIGFAEPDGVVMHPTDWQTVVTHQIATGAYLYGSPQDTVAKRMWGVPTVVTPAIAQGTALCGDFRTYSYVLRRMDLRIDLGWVNDDFIKNQRTVRAETRLALVIRRPKAFGTVTGITSAN